jgi:hypothetical protein
MHEITPFQRWTTYYNPATDQYSPFFGKEYDYTHYSEAIYGYYIDPDWDFMGSETLYIKILYANYAEGVAILEMMGEWNDALHNDCMHLKRNVIDPLLHAGITRFILIGENVFNFHGSDDSYYEEWYEEVVDDDLPQPGWIAAVSFPDFLFSEFSKFQIDSYVFMGGTLQIGNWRTMHPVQLTHLVESLVRRRLGE